MVLQAEKRLVPFEPLRRSWALSIPYRHGPLCHHTPSPNGFDPFALGPFAVSAGKLDQVVTMTARLPLLDVLRGLALVLMVLDHVFVVYGVDELRFLTRPALPLFMVVSGFLFHGLGPRYGWVLLAAALSWYPAFMLDFALLHILAVYVLVLPLLLLPLPWLVLVASGLFVAGYEYPLRLGYEPGYVLAFLVLGRLLRGAWSVPHFRFPVLEWIGRYPLSVYVLHIWLLWWWVLVVPTTFLSTENPGAL